MLVKINSRKAQAGMPAAIILLAIFLIVYVYSMPKSDKCEIMPDLKECRISAPETVIKPVTMLSDTPGFLEAQERSSVYAIKPAELFNREEIEVATILEKASINKSWFSSIDKKGVFPVHPRGKELKIYIYVSRSQGKLKVNINPHLNYEFEGAGLHELTIPINLLNDTNIITLYVSNPLLPQKTNFYEIEKVLVKETYSKTDLYAKRSLSIEQDLSQLEHASLSFEADCLTKELLSVTLNGKQVSKEIMCNNANLDITKNIKNTNELVFSSNGNYWISSIRANLYFKRGDYTTYYLVLDKDEFKDIRYGKKLAMLKFEFDSTANKIFDIKVNDETINAETDKVVYRTRINDYLIEGLNRIKIIPRANMTVSEIKLDIE